MDAHEKKFKRYSQKQDDFEHEYKRAQAKELKIQETKKSLKNKLRKVFKKTDEEQDPFTFNNEQTLAQALLRVTAELAQRRELVQGKKRDMTQINYIMEDIKGLAEDAGTELIAQNIQISGVNEHMAVALESTTEANGQL